jgi:hypothetical protein
MKPPGRDAWVARVAAWIDASLADAEVTPFEDLACALSAWQAEHAPLIAALRPTSNPTGLSDIPVVPIALYKDLDVGTVPPNAGTACFLTSGTTGGGRGVHRLWDTAAYDHGARRWAEARVVGAPRRVVALVDLTASSSLGHMVADFARPGGVLIDALREGLPDRPTLAQAFVTGEPVYLCATAFAMADWLGDDAIAPLPPGSVVMVTGGFKGRVVSLDEDALHAAIRARLRPDRFVLEYGMTELSSQLWGEPGAPYVAPPWMRVVAVDPQTGAAVAPGTPGQLRFYDLANVDSSVGVETLDCGTVGSDGRTVRLVGRIPQADARGCSLPVEEAWLAAGRRG